MKNLRIQINQNQLRDNSYSISRTSYAYSFFNAEYKSITRDSTGNIIIPMEYEKRENSIDILNKIKKRIQHKDKSLTIPKTSSSYVYFMTEYPCKLAKDGRDNLIIPEPEESKKRKR